MGNISNSCYRSLALFSIAQTHEHSNGEADVYIHCDYCSKMTFVSGRVVLLSGEICWTDGIWHQTHIGFFMVSFGIGLRFENFCFVLC